MTTNTHSFSLGADPELFFCGIVGGEPVPMCGKVGGTKMKPKRLPGMGVGYCIQEDNVMVEFNIPPARSITTFCQHIQTGLAGVEEYVRKLHPNLHISTKCAELFRVSDLAETKGAMEFGCSPDFDSYNNSEPNPKINPISLIEGKNAWRFAGGHIHFAYSQKIPHFVIANLMDAFVGLRMVPYDKQGKRRTMYGTAGRFRPTSYGIEYRTLSNSWIFHSGITQIVADGAMCLHLVLNERSLADQQEMYAQIPWEDVKLAINTENDILAKQIRAYLNSEGWMV